MLKKRYFFLDRFQNVSSPTQGTDEDIDTSDIGGHPQISATSSSDTLTEDTVFKSEENLRTSHSPQPLPRSPQHPVQSQQSSSYSPKPLARSSLPKTRESLSSAVNSEKKIKTSVSGERFLEKVSSEVVGKETMPGVATESGRADHKMDANFNTAVTQEDASVTNTSSGVIDPNGNMAATATNNQNVANANNKLNSRSQSTSSSKFDPITKKPIPAERHNIRPSISRTSARDAIDARAVDLEKPRPALGSGEVALPLKQKNQPQLMGYRKRGSFTIVDAVSFTLFFPYDCRYPK